MRARLKEYREAHRKRQADVAAALGVSSNYYAMIERGERSLNDEKMQKLAEFYDVPVAQLIDQQTESPTINAAVSLVYAIASNGEFPPAGVEILKEVANMTPQSVKELARYAAFLNKS